MGKKKKRSRKSSRQLILAAAAVCCLLGGSVYYTGMQPGSETEDTIDVIDKDAYYEGWGMEKGLSLDGLLLSADASAGSRKLSVKCGKLKRKDFELLEVSGAAGSVCICKQQGISYLKDSYGRWHKTDNMDMDAWAELWKTAAVQAGNIEVIKSRYVKTVKSDGKELDVIQCIVPDYAAMEKAEKERQETAAVQDDGYGNEVPVVIYDASVPKDSIQEEMEVRVYLDEDGDIKKLLWPTEGTDISYTVQKIDAVLPNGAGDAAEEMCQDWINLAWESLKTVLQ